MSELNKVLKKVNEVSLFTEITKPVGYFDTGLPGLNYIISGDVHKGLPYGRICELFGNESNGKSTIAYSIISKAQESGALVMLIDTEGAFDQSQAMRCGIDIERLIYFEPKSIVELFKTVYRIIANLYTEQGSTVPLLIVWDSVAASSVLEEEKGEKAMDNNAAGQLARNMSNGLNKLVPSIMRNPVHLLCLNQTRMNLSGWKPVIDTPGGKSLKFYSSIRLQVSRTGDWKEDSQRKGILTEIMAVKNKIYRPFLKCSIPISYVNGAEREQSLVELAHSLGVMETVGGWIQYGEEKRRKAEWMESIKNDVSLQESLLLSIGEALKGTTTVVPEEASAIASEEDEDV